jgi:hypothetical protein
MSNFVKLMRPSFAPQLDAELLAQYEVVADQIANLLGDEETAAGLLYGV